MIINFFNKLYDIVNKLFLSRLLVTFLAITLLAVLLFSGASIQQQHSANAVNHLSEVQENSSSIGSHNDQTLASRTLYSQAGAEVWEIQNNGFTRDVIGNPTVINNLRFPGQYFDEETSTYYNYHRNYNPHTGRYIQSDPIGLEGGVNGYAYVEGNPVLKTDPNGLIPIPAATGLLGGLMGGFGAAFNAPDGCGPQAFANGFIIGGLAGAAAGFGFGGFATATANISGSCSGLIKPDTELGGKIKPSSEVKNEHRTSEFYSGI